MHEISTESGTEVRPARRHNRLHRGIRVTGAALVLIIMVACDGNDDAKANHSSSTGGNESTENTNPGTTTAPFEVRQDWSLPRRVTLSPRVLTAELCQDHWQDKAGSRQPLVQAEPPVVRVDGRCNTPLDSEEVGIYDTPEQAGHAPIVAVNGDALGVECYEAGQPIQDIRGSSSNSNIWLGVVTRTGDTGLIPEVNVGYFDESTIRQC